MKLKFVLLLFILLPCLFFEIQAQAPYALPFLIASPDARGAGMGETGTAIADNINASFWNPAGLGFLRKTQVGKSSTIYFESSENVMIYPNLSNSSKSLITSTNGIYVKPLGGTIAIDYTLENIGEFTRIFENGAPAGKFNSSEYSIGFTYGAGIGENLALGAKLKFIGSNPGPYRLNSENYTTFGVDLGMLWYPNITTGTKVLGNKFLAFGLALQNMGPKLTYINESEPLPTNLRIGSAMKLTFSNENTLTIAIDENKILVNRDSLGSDPFPKNIYSSWEKPFDWCTGIGAEFSHDRTVFLRAGYYSEPRSMGDRSYITVGASVRVFIFQGDVSYAISDGTTKLYSNVLRIGLRIGG